MRPPPKTSKIAMAVRIALLSSSPWLAAHAGAPLPVPCPGGTCGAGVSFASYGSASWAQSGSKLTVNQTSTNAILNWQSFNIAAGNTVQFVQPSTSSVALNEIYGSSPSRIFGALDANGHIFLINQNGIIFGAGATVNVGGLVASTLQLSPLAAVATGTAQNYYGLLEPGKNGLAAFQAVTAANGNVLSQPIVVQQGAAVESADGGQVYMFAPQVTNLGTIQTPEGQTILAAGTSVYLAEGSDPNLRGLLVEVQGTSQNSVTNGLAADSSVTSPQQLVGQIIAQDGNISLAALAVNQYGRLNATTSVTENGSIYLQARSGIVQAAASASVNPTALPENGGTLVLGQNSDTEVTLDSSDPTETVDTQAQPKSTIEMSGATIQMLQDSVARATGGVIDVYTAQNLVSLDSGNGLALTSDTSDGSRFYMAPGAELDVSGASITLPVSANIISAQLLATELEDSPDQRGGPLQGQTIDFDIRAHGTNADGSTWWGTPLADVAGEILAIERDVVERNLDGGTINIQSQGDVILAPGSTVNVSGGYVQYTGGYIDTSELLTPWGQSVPVASANPSIPYVGIVNTGTTTDAKWGATQTYQTTPSYYSPGYVEGKDAGTLDLSAPNFILDGTVSASTVVGPYQTQPTTPVDSSTWIQETTSSGTEYSMYRPYDEVPAGATLVIGTPGGASTVDPNLVVGNVNIAPGEVLSGLQNADGSAFNPLTDPLPASFTTSTLQPSLLEQFQNVDIYTNGKLIEASGVDLSLAPGGDFTAQAASIDIQGGIDAPSGVIDLTAESTFAEPYPSSLTPALVLGPSASLTAVGAWINDSTTLYPNGNTAPVYINGGSVSLTAAYPNDTGGAASMQLEPGSLIDVSAGAELTSSGTLDAGKGGSIAIDDSTAPATNAASSLQGTLPPPTLDLGATLRGYALYQGGSLSISAAGVCIAASDCSDGDPTVLWLTPQFFNSGGFASYSIGADQNGLSLAPGLSLDLIQHNLELTSGYRTQPDAPSLEGFATAGILPLQSRQHVDLTLSLDYPANVSLSLGSGTATPVLQTSASLPSLVIPQGDVISTDPQGSISLISNTAIDVEGELQAPGGTISLTLATVTQQVAFDPALAIWLGPQGVLDASGTAEIFPNSTGDPTGSVLAGGTVRLDAGLGDIELLPGSVINVSGTSGTIDIMPVGGGRGQDQRIASAGGTIDLSADAGMVVGGTLEGSAGIAGGGAGQPMGGTLNVSLNPLQGSDIYSGNPITDEILLSPSLAPTVVAPGSAVPNSLVGLALLPTSAWSQGGFSTIFLQSVLGTIGFSGGATLAASYEASLDAASYTVSPGTTGSVEAPYVEFGNSYGYTNFPTTTATPGATGVNGSLSVSSGTGTLDVSGGFIELYGTSSLQGIGTANFDSSGDLRVRGIQYGSQTSNPTGTISGALYADGNVNLTSDQIYPSTLTQFLISADPSMPDPATTADLAELTSGSITIQGSEGTDTDLLSAGGSLTLSAALITQDGVLRAPFGTIALDAISLTLGPGSLTSTSANGLTIPFGETQGNTGGGAQNTYDWIYALEDSITAVYGTDGLPPPSQHIELNGTNVDVQRGATIDVSGGGDLQAYEWVPGPDGTNDVLASSTSFAIIPDLNAQVAPYDPGISASSTLQPGEAVYLSGGSGVPAGTYILLPARYALLPGAYLVTPETGSAYQDMQPGQTFEASDGGTIVSGYLTVAGLSYASSRLSGFDVTPSSDFLNEAQYNLTTGNEFFSSQLSAAESAAAGEAVSAMRLPQDAGVLDLNAVSSLTLDGTLQTTVASGARGAEVDISNSDIVVAANTGGVTASGGLVLGASTLNALGAQTLLLGGEDSDGTIETTAQSVTLASGADLTGPQVLLTAQNLISVNGGASITASGAAPSVSAVSLSGNGAFLAVSAASQASSQITLTRTGATAGPGAQGVLDLASGSSLTAGQGSVYLDATGGITTDGSLSATGGNLAVQAPQIALGSVSSTAGVTVLGSNVLGGNLDSLLLVSPAGITVGNGASASAQNITIDAPGLVSSLATGQSATLSATGSLSLDNSQGTSIDGNGSQSGALTLTAPEIILQSAAPTATGAATPTFGIEGFSTVALNAQSALTAANDIDLSTDGSLSITTSALTSGTGATATITAAGPVALLAASSPDSSVTTALGGSLAITGSSIDDATAIDLPSGDVTLTASGGDIALDSGGTINVAGVVQQYGATSVATPGGNVSLSASGDIDLASGSSINVSAGTGGDAGSLSISAPTGTVSAQGTLTGQGAAQGGGFSVEALSFGAGSGASCDGFCALSTLVNAGGFTGSQSYWLTAPASGADGVDNPDYDMTLASDQMLQASTVLLEADQGAIDIEGKINASGSSGGSVTLSAANAITLGSNGVIDAQATSQGGNGGTVELDVENPGLPGDNILTLAEGSNINVSGGGSSQTEAGPDAAVVLPGTDGSVLLRVPYLTVENVANGLGGITLAGKITGASSAVPVTLEAYEVYQNPDGVDLTSADTSTSSVYYTNASNFMTEYATPATAQLDPANTWNFTLEPGVEIDANGGSITLDSPWDLSPSNGWRFTGAGGTSVAGILTLRATGGITFNDSLSDGFTSPTSGTLISAGSGSWSYRIVAGADLNAANPLAVTTSAAQPPADVTIGSASSGAMVRTGTGFIDVAASGDFVLANPDSVLYTAGKQDTDPADSSAPPRPTCGGSSCGGAAVKLPPYAVDGGNINIDVGDDIDGSPDVDQFVNDWLWRQGGELGVASGEEDAAVAWSVEFAQFDQGVGALAGGDVTVHAGGDIDNFSASIATIGVAESGGSVDVKDGGTLTVSAGGSILGGSYYVGAGGMTLAAGNSVGPDAATGTVSPLIGLGEASVSVTARGNVQVSDIVSPTLLSSGASEVPSQPPSSSLDYFSTYGSASSASLTSIGGNVTLDNESAGIEDQYDASFFEAPDQAFADSAGVPVQLDILPPVLDVYALGGDIDISRDVTLFPSSQGNFEALASGSVNFGTAADPYAQVIVPDADPAQMPSIANPSIDTDLAVLQEVTDSMSAPGLPNQHDSTPLFSSVSAFDENPVQVVALDGNITFSSTDGYAGLWSGKPVIMSAGGDIVDANIYAQNLTAADVTAITAGGDISYPQTRAPTGTILGNSDYIWVAGPGELQVTAGGNVDLGTSEGIQTRGNEDDSALPSTGASISVEAGVNATSATTVQYNAFIEQYIDGSSEFDGQLVTYVEGITGQTGLTDAEAKQEFSGMSTLQQRTFVEQLFFYLLQTYGSEAAKSGDNADFAGAYAAIQTLFPGANAATSATNPYVGNIALYFSQIYTDDGGNISLLAPGGEINAGLALAPTGYGVNKQPQQLGIVAERTGNVDSFSYGDFEVNQSRVFSADGGAILVWSTEGDIDAGRGSKTSLSASAPSVTYDSNGFATIVYNPPNTGSGIQALADAPGVSPGSVYLFAPHGVVNANEGGIIAGNLTIAATAVLGTNNITVTGTAVGLPTVVTGTGAQVVGASSSAAGAVSTAQSSLPQTAPQQQAPKAAAELGWLDVFVLGFGEQTCSANDVECLKRQKHTTH